jgi:hypothetical protein
MRFAINLQRNSRAIFLLTSHGRALRQGLDLPLQLLDPTMRLQAIMRVGVRSTGRTLFLLEGRNILHRRRNPNKCGSRERRGGRSRHDNMREGVLFTPRSPRCKCLARGKSGREERTKVHNLYFSSKKSHESPSRATSKVSGPGL